MSICSQFYLVYSIFFAISCVKTNKLPFCQIISIYALLAEGDLLEGYGNDNPGAFQSTPSSRRATSTDSDVLILFSIFQSTPSSRRATYSSSFARWASSISIHALLTEGDDRFHGPLSHVSHFNPRPPHGGRLCTNLLYPLILLFQSTPSSRRATAKMTNLSFFNFAFLPKAYIFLI